MTPRDILLPVLTSQERDARWRKAFVESFQVPAYTLDAMRYVAVEAITS